MTYETKKSTILVVDDSRLSMMHLVQILQDDYILHTASSGVEAVQVARAVKPDIILLDIVMPQMDGYEALSVLRETHETKDIPVIFISSLDQEVNEEKGLALGAADYISKPYNPAIVKLRVSVQLKIVNQMNLINSLSLTDPITKLPNRRYFDLRLSEEWARAKNEGKKLGILIMEVDKFRSFSTKHGYKVGDALLIAVADIISKQGTQNVGDIVARWTNSGFVVLLHGADHAICNTVSEAIRRDVEELSIDLPEGTFSEFTVSIGGNSSEPKTDYMDLDEFVSNADSSMYLAKELGRNQVVIYT